MDAARVARRLADEYDTHDPFLLCKYLDIIVLRHPLISIRGYYKGVDGLYYAVLADDLPEHVERFVCAHELGHHMLHRGMNRIFMDFRTHIETGRYEISADRFACNLLYSESPMFNEQCLTQWEMSECLNVPACLVDARLIELGIYF